MTKRRFWVTRGKLAEGFMLGITGKTLETLHVRYDAKRKPLSEDRTKKKYASEGTLKAAVKKIVSAKLAEGFEEYDEKWNVIEQKKERPKLGKHLDAVIALIERFPKRDPVPKWKRASQRAAPDAREFLDAAAERAYQTQFIGDLVFTEDDHDATYGTNGLPLPKFPKNILIFSQSQKGDLYALDLKPSAKKTRVMRLLQKQNWKAQEEARSLEEFFRNAVKLAKKEGEKLDFEI